MPGSWSRTLTAGLSALSLVAATACGSGGGGSGGGGRTVAGVGACLQSAGYGVTVVPTSQIVANGPENRGPGQTGELLVGRQGAKPSVGADDADAVVAFWRSASSAKSSPNAKAKGLGMHADSIGPITVQPTTRLVLYAIHAATSSTGRRAAFQAQIKKIEACVS